MNKYIIEANGKPLDTFDDFNISLNYQIEDIMDITKRKTNFSKTIELPGTKNNNLFFQQIFDVNIDNINFNPNIRIPANIRIGDNDILNGNLQLVNIISENEDVRYEVVVAGTLKDIINTFQDYYISDLDYSEYNHIRNRQNIIDSWTHLLQINGLEQQVETGRGYVYPYIVTGGNDDITDNWYVYDAYPAVYVKDIMDRIFRFSDFTYTSDFLDSDYFKSLIIPFSENKLQINKEEQEERKVFVGVDGSLPEIDGGTTATGYSDLFGNKVILWGQPWFYNNSLSYRFRLNRDSGTVGDIEFQDLSNQWDELAFTSENQGYYDVSLDAKLVPKWFSQQGQDIRWKGDGNVEYIYYLIKSPADGSPSSIIDSSQGDYDPANGVYPTQLYQPSNTGDNASPWYDTEANLNIGLSAENLWMEEGDRLVVRFGVRWPDDVRWDIDGVSTGQNQLMRLRMTLAESVDGSPSKLEVTTASNTSYGNEDININQIVPKIKMKDFFMNITKMFNLIIQDNPNIPQDLIIEPRDDFFNSRNKVKDWNQILDNDSEIKITPMSELDANTYRYKYKKDGDFFNEKYLSETGKEYGEVKIDVINDFSEKTVKNELIFSPTPNSELFIKDRVAPFFVDIQNQNNLSPKKVNHRILFYNGLLDCETFTLADDENTTTEFTTLTQYPYCGMYNSPYDATEDLGFSRTDKIYWDTQTFPVNNLYEKYHKSTILSITDINSRLLEASFRLTPSDIAEFDFRDIIFLLGSYWRVNKIMGYNPVGSDNVTKVVLYRLNDVEIFNLDEITIPSSNGSCPVDLQSIVGKGGEVTIVSSSGEEVTADCCNSLGGQYFNGRCIMRPIGPVGPIGSNPVQSNQFNSKTQQKYSYSSIGVIPYQEKQGDVVQTKNNNSYNTSKTTIIGSSNYTSEETGNSLIIGDNNSSLGNNTLIIGDNITATEEGIYIGGIAINGEGDILDTRPYITDGGLDEVIRINRTNLIEKIDGGLDSVRNTGGDSKLRPIIMNSDFGTQID
jgi:hypothetical protein